MQRVIDRRGEQALLALVHFVPLSLLWLAAVTLESPPVHDSFGPVITALRAEQWVGPPCVGAFMVLLGVYQRSWPDAILAILRFVGWVTVSITVFAFGVAGFWADSLQIIFVYSLTTPLFVVPMVVLSWRHVRLAMEARDV